MESFIGKQLQLDYEEDDGFITYKGTVKNVDTRQKKLIIKNVFDITNDKKLRNEKHCFGEKIKDLKILQDAPLDKESRPITSDVKYEKKNQNSTLYMDTADEGTSLFQMDHLQPSNYINGIDSNFSDLSLNEPPKVILIDKIDSSFYQAHTMICNQKNISMLVDGPKINRFGDISLLTIGTRHMVYLFDIESLGNDAFQKGLLSVIENPNILKICHDVRMVSDCLQGRYHIHPVNIFDTQVADAFVHKNENGTFPEKVSSLSECVKKHLPIEDLGFDNKSLNLRDRPISMETQRHIALRAMYLRELRTIMMEKLLADYLYGVDIYLKTIRQEPDHGLKFVNTNKLPREMIKQFSNKTTDNHHRGKFQTSRRKNNNRNIEDELEDETFNDFVVQQSNRSAWDAGETFSQQYQEKHGEIVESMGDKFTLLNHDKPILRQSNSPNLSDSQRSDKESTPLDIKGKPHSKSSNKGSDSDTSVGSKRQKSHVRQFKTREQNFDDYQFSTTSDSDCDPFLVTSGDREEYDMAQIEELMKMEMNKVNNKPHTSKKQKNQTFNSNKEQPSKGAPHISNAGKRMIMRGLGAEKTTNNKSLKPPNQQLTRDSYYSSSPASSVDPNEYPSLQEAAKTSSKTSPGDRQSKSKFNNDQSGHHSPYTNGVVSPSFNGSGNSQNDSFSSPIKPRGRGQILRSLTENQTNKNRPPPGFVEIGAPRQIREMKTSYDFPSDDELLDTPHVLKAVEGTVITGENVSVLKKKYTSH
eukprot:TCONS_00048994-protein